jgi:hypothetical protein
VFAPNTTEPAVTSTVKLAALYPPNCNAPFPVFVIALFPVKYAFNANPTCSFASPRVPNTRAPAT